MYKFSCDCIYPCRHWEVLLEHGCYLFVMYILVCSCTIWLGHLSKTIKQQQINEAFEDYGQVRSVDVSVGKSKI